MAVAKRHDSNMRLTDLGREQARLVGGWLRENGPRFDQFYVSEYIRTKETAGEMNLDGAVWQPDIMIRERDQGVQDGGGDVKLGLDPEEQFDSTSSAVLVSTWWRIDGRCDYAHSALPRDLSSCAGMWSSCAITAPFTHFECSSNIPMERCPAVED